MATKESLKDDGKQFGDAFDEEDQTKTEPTDDEVFGLNLPETDGETSNDSETSGSPVATQAGDADDSTDNATDTDASAGNGDASPSVDSSATDEADTPMTQAEKSWDGRLRKREEELKALADQLAAEKAELDKREAAFDSAGTTGSTQENQGGDGSVAAANGGDVKEISDAANNHDAGEAIDADAAIKQLSEDFGEDFVKMIMAIATKKAEEAAGARVGDISNSLNGVIGDINDNRAKRHFKEIYRAHPDFVEVSESDGFKKWIESLPPDQKAEANGIIEDGDSYEINALLSKYKDSVAHASSNKKPENEDSVDAAEGVRSTGLRLPDDPESGADDYKDSWDKFD